jgi:hypothetical protein
VAKLDIGSHLDTLPYASTAPLKLALTQGPDGIWNNAMLSVPAPGSEDFHGVGTIPAFQRLLEYGWDSESPPLIRSRRTLFRLLAEDDDPAYLFELGVPRLEPEMVQRGRAILREAAAAALAQAGYEGDPRLRGAAQRMLQRVDSYLRSSLAEKPWVRVGNRQVLASDATPPSIYLVTMVAHMPLFRSEHHAAVERLFRHLSQALPRQELHQLVGGQVVSQPHLVLGDMLPNRNAADADVPFALMWLELMARLHFLRRAANWLSLFERFLDDRDRDLVWHPHRGQTTLRSTNPAAWPLFPLETQSDGSEGWSDVTFRLGLIARLIGRPIELT